MKRILLITGPAGDAQGWGDFSVTQTLRDALCNSGKHADIAFVETRDDLIRALENIPFDIIWSALYHVSDRDDIVGVSASDDAWLADLFDARGLPYIGPDARAMKQLIDKTQTHQILQAAGAAIPDHHRIDTDDPLPAINFPAFVKPSCESRSVGIDDGSVVNDSDQLQARVDLIHGEFQQPALVEDYLPGDEYTVLMIGNGDRREFLPGMVVLEGAYGAYPILRADMRGVGKTKINRPESRIEEAVHLGRQAVDALNCLDHVRVDMRLDRDDQLRIIEVNGIPGLKPIKSWSPQLYTIYHGCSQGPLADHRNMVNLIVDSALKRWELA